jgi:hypothetical protein
VLEVPIKRARYAGIVRRCHRLTECRTVRNWRRLAHMWSLTPAAETLDNNKMQRTKHGLDEASPLILVLGRQRRGAADGVPTAGCDDGLGTE